MVSGDWGRNDKIKRGYQLKMDVVIIGAGASGLMCTGTQQAHRVKS